MKVKKVIKIVILIILVLLLLIISSHIIKNTITKIQVNNIKKDLDEISSYKVSYVILEINPKILLEITNDIVTNKTCLNKDCEESLTDLDLNGKNLKVATTTFYEEATSKGFDTSNGVTVSTSDSNFKEEIEELEYVNYNVITKEEENDVLNELNIKEEILNKKNEYNKKLIDIYKKDSDYDKYYSCDEENNDVKCYITSKFEKELSELFVITNLNTIINNARNLNRILDKFNVKYEYQNSFGVKDIIAIEANGTYLSFGNDYQISSSDSDGSYHSIHYNFPYLDLDDSLLPLIKFNLIDSSYDVNDLIVKGEEY